jgi:hypothetical protein
MRASIRFGALAIVTLVGYMLSQALLTRDGGDASRSGVIRMKPDLLVYPTMQTWQSFGVRLESPLVVKAYGYVISQDGGEVQSTPDGVYEDGLPAGLRRVVPLLPTAPYLAFVGRVCNEASCGNPFFIGRETVLCPQQLGSGVLEFNVNEFGAASFWGDNSGGYRFELSSARLDACPAQMRYAFFTGKTVTVKGSAWQRTGLSLDRPLKLDSTGKVYAGSTQRYATPDGLDIKVFSSAPEFSGEQAGRPRLPYDSPFLSLIGRLCEQETVAGDDKCGEPFFVGSESTLCPATIGKGKLQLAIHDYPHGPWNSSSLRGNGFFQVNIAPSPSC